MRYDDDLYNTFLTQMQDLETFRMAYAATHAFAGLDRDDPDVKRLIEALGFFCARTHRAGMNNIIASHMRIFQQFFAYILTPLPAMGVMRAVPSGQFVDNVLLPKGTHIAVNPAVGGDGAMFRTLHELRILPIALADMHMAAVPGAGNSITLQFRASYPRNDEIGWLRIYIHHLNDFVASAGVWHALKANIRKVSVAFGKQTDGDQEQKPCEIRFGEIEPDDPDQWLHPIQTQRLFFHFPQQEMYLNIKVPRPPRNWDRFTLLFELDDAWPQGLVLSADTFHLFTTPIINLSSAMAQTIACHGMKERHLILHPSIEDQYEVHSIRGVYEARDGGMAPLRPGVLSGGSGSYESEQDQDRSGRCRHWLTLDYPAAAENPRTISVDAYWMQPSFSNAIHQKLRLTPYHHSLADIDWELVGSLVPHAENTYGNTLDNYLLLLSLNNRSMLTMDELRSLIHAMGSITSGSFKEISDLLVDVRVERGPGRKEDAATPSHLIYYLIFKNTITGTEPLVKIFTRHMERILDAWISDATIEVRTNTLRDKNEIPANRRGTND